MFNSFKLLFSFINMLIMAMYEVMNLILTTVVAAKKGIQEELDVSDDDISSLRIKALEVMEKEAEALDNFSAKSKLRKQNLKATLAKEQSEP